ncbi:MAG: MFS transporter [Actinobacteria bacterium]|nr:MAG: MFS transporter [Actinomycetota bacterium]
MTGRPVNRVAIDTRPLRHPAYRRVFIGNSASFFGTQVTAVAVPVQMYALTHSSLWVGYLGIAGLVPLLVFALWGGALADALDRRRLFLVASSLSCLVTLALLGQALLRVRSPGLLLGLVAVQSAAVAVASSTASAIVPRIVPLPEIPAANTLSFTAATVAGVAGPLAAGAVIRYDIAWAYGIDAVTFSLALWGALRLPPLLPGHVAGRSGAQSALVSHDRNRAGWSDVLFGLRYIGTHKVLLLSFAIDIVAMVLAQPRALFPAVAQLRFGGNGAIGWLFASIALGSAVAGLTSGWIGRIRRQGLALVCAVVVWGLAVAAAGLARQLWLAVALLALGGAADLVSAVYRQTILQTYAPDELRGRMGGVFTAVVAGGPRLGDLRAGAMAVPLGITTAWVGGGLACVAVAVLLAAAFPALVRYRT